MAGVPIDDPWALLVIGLAICIMALGMWWVGYSKDFPLVFGLFGALMLIRGCINLAKGRN